MNMWRWFGASVFAIATLTFLGAYPVTGQDKKDEKKAETKKADEGKKDETKKDETKKDDTKKDEPKKQEETKKVEVKTPEKAPETKSAGGWQYKAFEKAGKHYVTLTTDTEQVFKVMGQEVKQEQKQTFHVELVVADPSGDNYNVTQKIVGVSMNIDIGGNKIAYDSAAKSPANPMTEFFAALTQAELKLTINKNTLEVSKVEGGDALIEKLGGANPQLVPLLKSILSAEALKQMAEPTWAAFPTKAVKTGDSWTKDAKLDLGGIGLYSTKYTYKLESDDANSAKVKVDAALTYSAPQDKRGLPFTIKSAALKSTEGSGSATINKEKGRIENSSISMKLEGELDIEIAGMTTKVNLVQSQKSTVTASDTNPVASKK